MNDECVMWFIGQALAVALAALVGILVARRPKRIWLPVATAATLVTLVWPLVRLCPTWSLDLVGARLLVFVEVTGIVVPAALVFAIAARHLNTARARRLTVGLLAICLLYFAKNGLWMLSPPVPNLNTATYVDGVCRQSTGYTCVAASLVTLLHAYGIETTETEMARLSFTEVNGGATDVRAVYALERKLAGTPWGPHYERMDYDRLCAVPKPCLVTTTWGYFTSHMLPVMDATATNVIVGDPLTGPCNLSPDEFRREWHRRGIYLIPVDAAR